MRVILIILLGSFGTSLSIPAAADRQAVCLKQSLILRILVRLLLKADFIFNSIKTKGVKMRATVLWFSDYGREDGLKGARS
ncbi:MAG: hypothetical protein AB7S78_10885 [Candidatus Omnitrophota bacterium]